jgi:hypothetical protein
MKNFFIFFLVFFSTSFDAHAKELRILYFGNSISLHGNPLNLPISAGSWGMSATEQSKDYILQKQKIGKFLKCLKRNMTKFLLNFTINTVKSLN